MLEVLIGVVCGLVASVGTWVALKAYTPSAPTIDKLFKREIVVQTDNEIATHGLLEASTPDYLILTHARHLEGGQATPLTGEVWVPRERIWRVEAIEPSPRRET